MKRVKLKVEARKDLGRGPARRLRVAGKIPAVVYGTSGAYGLTVDQAEFRTLSREVGDSAAIVELEKGDGVELLTVIQEVQRDALKDRVNHIDFHEVNAGVEMTAHVPIHVINDDKCYGVNNVNLSKSMLSTFTLAMLFTLASSRLLKVSPFSATLRIQSSLAKKVR